MKNYIGLYIIIALLFGLIFSTFIFMNDLEINLLKDAKELAGTEKIDENTNVLYKKIEENFYKMEPVITSFINHSVYREIIKKLDNIKYDIQFEKLSDFKKDAAGLLKILEEIIDNEKPKINNIF